MPTLGSTNEGREWSVWELWNYIPVKMFAKVDDPFPISLSDWAICRM